MGKLEGKVMNGPPITLASRSDAARCSAVLTLSFSCDPACRWAWPDPRQYLDAFPSFVRAFGGRAFDLGSAYRLGDFSGVALWLPPGEVPDEEEMARLIRRSVADHRQDALFSVFEQMAEYHPREPHWHLPLIGVDPTEQGKGYGSVLLGHMLAECDRGREPAYLEATSPRNVTLYERHGFEALGRIQVAASPPIVPMLRRPRSPSGRW